MKRFIDHPVVKGYNNSNKFGTLLGMDLKVLEQGEILYTMPVTAEHLATPVAAHGGAVSALMDATMGVCALSEVIADGKVVSTIEMKVSFIAPAIIGDVLYSTAEILKKGNRMLFVEGKIKNQNDKLIAVASGTFNSYPAEKVGFM